VSGLELTLDWLAAGSPAKKSSHPSGKPVPSASPALTVPHVITRKAVAIRATIRTPEVFRHLVDSSIIMISPFYRPNHYSLWRPFSTVQNVLSAAATFVSFPPVAVALHV
jgi:hypothetical protein